MSSEVSFTYSACALDCFIMYTVNHGILWCDHVKSTKNIDVILLMKILYVGIYKQNTHMAYLCPQVVLNLICFELTAVVKKNVEISLKSNFLTQTYKKK